MKKAETPQKPELKTRAEAEAAVAEMARLTAILGANVANRDKEMVAITDRYAPGIAAMSENISAQKEAVETWAKANRKEFGDKQSLEFPAGIVAFHKGQRAVSLLPKWTWKTVLAALKGSFKKYRRTKYETDKVAILADAAGEKPKLTPERLKKIGVEIVQEETFDIELRACPNTLGK